MSSGRDLWADSEGACRINCVLGAAEAVTASAPHEYAAVNMQVSSSPSFCKGFTTERKMEIAKNAGRARPTSPNRLVRGLGKFDPEVAEEALGKPWEKSKTLVGPFRSHKYCGYYEGFWMSCI